MTIEKAIKKLKKKDEAAFEFIYEETKGLVYSVILTIVKDKNTIEDIMQDTYIKMIKSINSYDLKLSFNAWIATIAKNTSIDYYRKQKRLYSVDIHESEYLFPHTKSDVDNEFNANYLLSKLSKDEQDVVILYAMDNLKHREIAELLDKPIGTITWIYNNAMKKMKEYEKEIVYHG